MKASATLKKNKTPIKPNAEAGKAKGRPKDAPFKWPIYDSIGQCAAHSKVPIAILKEAKRLGCPAFRSTRIHFDEFLPWMFATLMDDKATNWGEELKRAQTMRERIKLAEDDGRVVDRATVSDGIAKAVGIMFGELDRVFTSELPTRGKGMDELGLRKLSVTEIEKIKTTLRDKLQPLTKTN
ncbi:MAG: hypothetical protein QM813_26285 [Verrucomicrobiota bacterium]